MPKILRKKHGLLPLINGVNFEKFGEFSLSENVSDTVAESFLNHAGYELHVEPKEEIKPPAAPAETAAQRKARLKAEQDAIAAEAKRIADEEADRLKAEEEANASGGEDDAGSAEDASGSDEKTVF